ncbi:hypothetical protein GBA52_013606 [Prunus armeniaca]|nr:hypothetical protein GBA52_013606 [Prunus armeniaca]
MESNRFRAAIWDPPKLVATCLSSHLKTICIRRFWARKVQMEVVKYLLENGHLLDKMIIMYAGYFPREEAELNTTGKIDAKAAALDVVGQRNDLSSHYWRGLDVRSELLRKYFCL